MKEYEIFLFDADGTLFDFDLAEESAIQSMCATSGLPYSPALLIKYREISAQLCDDFEKGVLTQTELQTLRFSRLFDEIGFVYDASHFNGRYLVELGKGSFLLDGAVEICKELVESGRVIYIVTNGFLAPQTARIENSPIIDYVSGYFVSEAVGFQKPHPSYFDYVFSHIPPVKKEKVLIVGDSLSADIAGGNNAGIDSCWLNGNGKHNETNIMPTYEIRELNELRGLVF